MMKKIIMFIALAMLGCNAIADVAVDMNAAFVNDKDGVGLSVGDMFLIAIDTDGDGVDGASLANYTDDNAAWNAVYDAGSFLWDADDVILFQGGLNNGSSMAGWFDLMASHGSTVTTALGSGIDEGDSVYAMWFSGVAGTELTPGAVSQVGFYTEGNWALPANNGTLTANNFALSQDSITVVPEPATALLLLIGGGCAWAGRRARRFHNFEDDRA